MQAERKAVDTIKEGKKQNDFYKKTFFFVQMGGFVRLQLFLPIYKMDQGGKIPVNNKAFQKQLLFNTIKISSLYYSLAKISIYQMV